MKKSLKAKLCMTGVCLIILFVTLNILFTYLWMSPFTMMTTARQLEKMANTMKKQMDLPEDEFQNYIEQISEDYGVTVTVIDEKKSIIATTSLQRAKKNKIGPVTESAFDENIDLLNKGKAIRVFKEPGTKSKTRKEIENSTENTTTVNTTQNLNGEPVRIIVLKKISDDRYVVLSRAVRSFYNATVAAIWFDMLAGVIIIGIGAFVVLKLSNYVVKPVNQITEVAEHIANLEFDMKAPENGKDELGQLGTSINRMSKHLESNLIQLQEDIDNRKKLVRNLSHEIKSPVAVIMGYSDWMKTVISKNPEKAVQYCEIISNESTRIDVLVKEMLDFSKMEQRMEELNLEKFPTKLLLERVGDRIREENMERKISLLIQCEDGMIVADYGLLERAVYNLANNAVRHGAPDNLQIMISGEFTGKWFMIKVHNTGSHIPEEDLPYIWEAFYKVDKARVRNKNGCGVGLSIVREIVEAHQGNFAAGNDKNGVCFTLWIPKKQ